MSPKTKIGIALVAVPLLCLFFYKFNPQETPYFLKCPMFQLTGLKCPGCGTQRAIHQLLHLNIAEAIRMNFLFIISIPVMAFTYIGQQCGVAFPRCHKIATSATYTITIVAIVFLWSVLRNIFNW